MRGQSDWAGLPRDLAQQIFRKLCATGCLEDILSLRLICKPWREAVSGYSGPVSVNLKSNDDLPTMCRMLPTVSVITIKTLLAEVDFEALLTCLHLSALHLTRSMSWQLHGLAYDADLLSPLILNCAHIPSSLVELTVDTIKIDPGSVQSFSCPQLRKVMCL